MNKETEQIVEKLMKEVKNQDLGENQVVYHREWYVKVRRENEH